MDDCWLVVEDSGRWELGLGLGLGLGFFGECEMVRDGGALLPSRDSLLFECRRGKEWERCMKGEWGGVMGGGG